MGAPRSRGRLCDGPCTPRPQHDGQRLRSRRRHGRRRRSSGECPNVFFHVVAACSFSECASTIVASRSTVTNSPSAPRQRPQPGPMPAPGPRPGERGPHSTPAAASPASMLTSRDITGSDATGLASSDCFRSTAMSARRSPPRMTAAARSATILPGSCTPAAPATGQGAPTGPRPGPPPASSPTAGRHLPARPVPFRQRTRRPGQYVRYSPPRKRLRLMADRIPGKSYSPRSKALLYKQTTAGNSRRKPEA